MIEVEAVIVNARGLHARPSTKLARLAAQYDSALTVYKGKRKADAKSVAGLLMLAAQAGCKLKITAKGRDEKEAITSLLELIAGGFRDDAVPNNPQTPEAVPEEAGGGKPVHKISGIGIGDSAVTGRAHIYTASAAEVPRYRIGKAQLNREIKRYEAALAQVFSECEALLQQTADMPGAAEMKPFIDLYMMLLKDKEFAQKPLLLMRRRLINAEWALKERVEVISDYFRRAQDSYLRERQRDIEQVMGRLLTAMKVGSGQRQKTQIAAGENAIIAALDLDPADLIRIHQSGYKGFVTESGGGNSHTAILARSINMPAVIGARGILACIQHNSPILLDPCEQVVIINPEASDIKKHKQGGKKKSQQRRAKSRGKGVKTRDGEQVFVHTNIELPAETDSALHSGSDGIGLFRTEFLFMHRQDLPSEDEQFEIYRYVLEKMKPLPVVIRTLDIGGDKMPPLEGGIPIGANPALGVRAIRYCLAMPDLFMTQLRALLRAAAVHNNMQLLLPMLAHPQELERTLQLLSAAKEQVRATHGIRSAIPPLGVMIEVPAAIFIMRSLARQLDFFSIGTNDLIQYLMAVDRNDETLLPLCDPLHPAVLQMLEQAVANARRSGLPVTLCGELAGDVQMTALILGLGLRRLSVTASAVEEVRTRVKQADCAAFARLARQILRAADPQAARRLLEAAGG